MNPDRRRLSFALIVLALLALISFNVSSGMSRAEVVWGHGLLRPGGGAAAAVWWISLLTLVSALIVGAILLVVATRTRNRLSIGSRKGGA